MCRNFQLDIMKNGRDIYVGKTSSGRKKCKIFRARATLNNFVGRL